MSIRPDFGPEFGEEEVPAGGSRLPGDEDIGEREIQEHEYEEEELEHLDPEDNELHAPGEICARCGAVIKANEDVRLLPDGRWMHEVCPRDRGVA